MEADPRPVERPTLSLELFIEAVIGALECQRRGAGVGRVIGIVSRRIPDPMMASPMNLSTVPEWFMISFDMAAK
jgi:hypothetical protein